MLRRGMNGDNVRRLQGVLQLAGLYEGRIDGRFGHMTESSVKDLQRALGVRVDGWYGPRSTEATADFFAGVNDPQALAAGKPAVTPYLGGR